MLLIILLNLKHFIPSNGVDIYICMDNAYFTIVPIYWVPPYLSSSHVSSWSTVLAVC